MKKIGIIGAFDFKNMSTGGQPVKTRQLHATLTEKYGTDQIICVDTQSWKKHIFTMLIGLVKVAFLCDRVIMLPAKNGVNYFSRILLSLKKLIHIKIYYDVIGGWLPELLESREKLCSVLKRFDCILVETETMRMKLLKLGFNNVEVLPNYKKLTCVQKEDLVGIYEPPYRLCMFARVMKEKGIEDALKVITKINDDQKKTIYTLDIFGLIDQGYQNRFDELRKAFPSYIKYCGVVDPSESVETLQGYYLLLFPTRFYTEGVPGTIIDAYAAGLPVLASSWESSRDIICDNKTGILYEFGSVHELEKALLDILNHPDRVVSMKKNCLCEYEKYSEDSFKKNLFSYIYI